MLSIKNDFKRGLNRFKSEFIAKHKRKMPLANPQLYSLHLQTQTKLWPRSTMDSAQVSGT